MGCSALLKKASLVGAFFVFALMVVPAQAFCPVQPDLPEVRVRQVLDGDTLKLTDGRSVRLIGLNTPELGRKGRPAEPGAQAAQRRLRELVAVGAGRVGLRLGSEVRDHYGRTLAHVYDHQGRNLEAQLLAEGLGYQVAVAPNLDLVECQRTAERQARAARLGLWRKAPMQEAGALRRGGFALLQGRVERVEHNGGGLWVELEGSLVVRVAPEALVRFDLRALQALPGRRVEVRGWVVDRARHGAVKPGQARWLLPVSHAAMLELLP